MQYHDHRSSGKIDTAGDSAEVVIGELTLTQDDKTHLEAVIEHGCSALTLAMARSSENLLQCAAVSTVLDQSPDTPANLLASEARTLVDDAPVSRRDIRDVWQKSRMKNGGLWEVEESAAQMAFNLGDPRLPESAIAVLVTGADAGLQTIIASENAFRPEDQRIKPGDIAVIRLAPMRSSPQDPLHLPDTLHVISVRSYTQDVRAAVDALSSHTGE
ncbi:MAG TPA: hypothetical protein PKL83_01625 [bacterium]|nr:hypothetical protein [bacterium]